VEGPHLLGIYKSGLITVERLVLRITADRALQVLSFFIFQLFLVRIKSFIFKGALLDDFFKLVMKV
jgi:hypothetical protein